MLFHHHSGLVISPFLKYTRNKQAAFVPPPSFFLFLFHRKVLHMVRPLDTALTTALTRSTRRPAVLLTVEDHVPHYILYQTPGVADALNDACIANDKSIVRAQVTRGGFAATFQVQRITDPASAAQWSAWATLPGAANVLFQDGGCAVSNSHGVLRAFAQRGTGGSNLYAWTSTDNGVTWTGPATVLTPPGNALLKGISSAGNDDVFFIYDVSGGEAIGCSFFTSGWSALTVWTLATLAAGAGLAVTWSGTVYTIVYSDSYTLATCTFTPATTTWRSGVVIAPATGSAIGRIAPRLSFASGIYTLACIEFDAGMLTGSVYSYPRLRQSVDLLHWSNGVIAHEITANYGIVLLSLPAPNSGTAGPRTYLASPAVVYSAGMFQSASPAQSLDVSNAILSYKRIEQAGKPARLEVVVDNTRGVFNSFVTSPTAYRPIGLHASLVLSEGYKVGTPPIADVVKVGVFHIEQIRFVRSPVEHSLLLVGHDLSATLDLVARYQNVYNNQTLGFLLTEVCARAGLFSVVLPATSQVSQIVGSFVLQAGSLYRAALNELCSTYGLSYFLDQNESMQFYELSSSDPSVWSYQPEIEAVHFGSTDQRANHIVVSGKPPLHGLFGALTTAEAYDDAHLRLLGVERLLHHVDPKLTTVAQCSQKAALLMANEARSSVMHTVTIPLNPALQLLDCVTLTDSVAPMGSGQQATCRIAQLDVRYDAHQCVNEMHLTLEGL